MKPWPLLFILLIGISLLTSALAQRPGYPRRIRFDYLTVADGLPENSVVSMLQDHLGFMWLGTQNGLVRYDGTTMTTFPYNPKNPFSMKVGPARALIEDRNGDLWVGGKGLFRYERSTGRFIDHPWQNTENIGGLELISYLHQDRRGDIWTLSFRMGSPTTSTRLNRFRPSTGQWTYFRHNPHTVRSLASNNISIYGANNKLIHFGFLEDKRGNVWVITQGETENVLHRFDPVSDQFQRIIPQTASPRTRADFKTIDLLTNDRSGTLYLSSRTAGKGLFRFSPSRQNPHTGHLQQYVHQPANPASLRSDSVYQVHVTRDGTVWVPTQHGLDCLNPQTNRFTHFVSQPNDPASPPPGLLEVLAETPDGNLWLADQNADKNDLVMFKRANEQFIRYPNDPQQTGALQIGKGILSFFVDNTGLIWVGGSTGGVSKQIRMPYFSALPPVPIRQPGIYPTLVYQAPSDSSVLWLGTAQGLTRLDRRTGQYTHYRSDSLNAHSIGAGTVVALTEDRKGRFWVATRPGGLYLMDRQRNRFQRVAHDPANANSLISSAINTLLAASDGSLWIGTLAGLDRFDPDRQQFVHYYMNDTLYTPRLYTAVHRLLKTHHPVAAIIHPGNNVNRTVTFSLAQSTDILVIVGGSWSQLDRLDYGWLENQQGQVIWETTYSDSRSAGLVFSENQNRRNQVRVLRLPAGCYRLRYQSDGSYGYGSWSYSPPYHPELWGIQLLPVLASESQQIAQLARQKITNGLAFSEVRSLLEDKHQRIWIATPINGLDRFDPPVGTFKNYYNYINGPISTMSLLAGSSAAGDVWAGDYLRGLLQLNAEGQLLHQYTTEDGLPANTIYSILNDQRGHLWLGTTNGLARLEPKTRRIRQFNLSNGLPDLAVRKLATTAQGELYVTTDKGTVVVYPTQLEDDRRLPPVVLTDLSIHDKPATLGPDGQLPVHISIARELILPYDQNSLTFHFAALQYSRGKECHYAYRLTPSDGSWVSSGTIRQARYSDLRPGRYVFSVKAANPDGHWNEKGVSIRVTIMPPWWQTWWAYLIYVLFFMSGLWAYIGYRSRSLRQQNQLLEEKVTFRTNQVQQQKKEIEMQRDSLEQSLNKLKATQDQLIQREKMASLGELTAGIAHEIQNPLNFVNNYSALSAKLIEQLRSTSSTTGPTQVTVPPDSRLLITLSKNLQKITQHGQRASNIVKSMLAHSRQSAGEHQPTILNALVEDYLRLAYHGQRAKDPAFTCQLVTDLDASIDLVVLAPQQIGQVLLNLLTNGFYALQQRWATQPARTGLAGSPPTPISSEQPTLRVSTRRLAQAVEIRVADNGVGMADAVKEKIFQPFFTTKPLGEGTGLGLSLSYEVIVKGHGGTLGVESQEGQGTTFIICIPDLHPELAS